MIRYTIVRMGPDRAHRYFWRIRKRGRILAESIGTFSSPGAAYRNLYDVVTVGVGGWLPRGQRDVGLEVKA